MLLHRHLPHEHIVALRPTAKTGSPLSRTTGTLRLQYAGRTNYRIVALMGAQMNVLNGDWRMFQGLEGLNLDKGARWVPRSSGRGTATSTSNRRGIPLEPYSDTIDDFDSDLPWKRTKIALYAGVFESRATLSAWTRTFASGMYAAAHPLDVG